MAPFSRAGAYNATTTQQPLSRQTHEIGFLISQALESTWVKGMTWAQDLMNLAYRRMPKAQLNSGQRRPQAGIQNLQSPASPHASPG
jgi:hypothetical protein